jgi:hypothetical protein
MGKELMRNETCCCILGIGEKPGNGRIEIIRQVRRFYGKKI